MYKAVITDLDGTLLDKEHKLSEYTIKIMQKFLKQGYKLYAATGRIEMGAKRVTDLIALNIPAVTSNGTRIIDSNQNVIQSLYIDEFARDIIVNFDYKSYGENIYINGYSDTSWLSLTDDQLELYFKNRIDEEYRPTVVDFDEFKNQKYNKLYYVGPYDKLVLIKENLLKQIGHLVNIDFVSKFSIEIYSKQTNKAKAIKQLLELDNIKEDEVVAFGDGVNDFEMLNYFPNSYIMGNALQELKDRLPNKEIIKTNDDDGVAKKIIELFKL